MKEVKTQVLEDVGQETEVSNFSQLEQQEKENAKLITALMCAEEEKAKLPADTAGQRRGEKKDHRT